MDTKIWAHRGSSHKYIENSLAAFEQAIEDQADGIELDVQRTKDGKLVVVHDENLNRLTGVNRFVWEMTWEEIQELSLSSKVASSKSSESSNIKIPTLEEVLLLMRDTDLVINIELKNSLHFYPGMEEEVVQVVKENDVEAQTYYSSFNHQSANILSGLVGPESVGVLSQDIQYEPWTYLKAIGAGALHPMINSLQVTDLVVKCKERGIKVHTWTADKDAHIYAGFLFGVDAVITNKPEKAVALRKQFIEDGGRKAMEAVKALGF